jgi:hypothetical protein
VLVKRIETEAIEALKKSQSFYIEDGPATPGTIGATTNAPAAEVWGIGGKSRL